MTLRKYYRPDEVAEILRVSLTTVYRLLANGEMKYIVVRRQKRIPVEELERFVNDNAGDPLDTKTVS